MTAACDSIHSSSWLDDENSMSSLPITSSMLSISKNIYTEDESICLTLKLTVTHSLSCGRVLCLWPKDRLITSLSRKRCSFSVKYTSWCKDSAYPMTVCVTKSALFKVQMLTQNIVQLQHRVLFTCKSEFTCTLNPSRDSFNCIQMYLEFTEKGEEHVFIFSRSPYTETWRNPLLITISVSVGRNFFIPLETWNTVKGKKRHELLTRHAFCFNA